MREQLRADITDIVRDHLAETADRPLSLVQLRHLAKSPPEWRAHDTEAARLCVAAVEIARAFWVLADLEGHPERRAALVFDKPDDVTDATIWFVPAERVSRALRRVNQETRDGLAFLLDTYDPTKEAVLVVLTAVDVRLVIFGANGSIRSLPTQPRPPKQPKQPKQPKHKQ